jgi:hypothetical protein
MTIALLPWGVSCADDFVIRSRARAVEALTWTKPVMTKLGLMINESKPPLRDARQERFTFFGYSFGPYYPYDAKSTCAASPSSVQQLKAKVRELLVPSNTDPWPEVRDDLNRRNFTRLQNPNFALLRDRRGSVPTSRPAWQDLRGRVSPVARVGSVRHD